MAHAMSIYKRKESLMEIIKFLIPMALGMGMIFVGLFIWSTRSGQFDDLDTPSKRMLLEDDETHLVNKPITHERKDV